MEKILLVYSPFCTPASPPYSIANLYGFLSKNLPKNYKVDAIDLNVKFHKTKFPKYYDYYKKIDTKSDLEEYDEITKEFQLDTKRVYYESNMKVVKNENPELFSEMLNLILNEKPEIVAFSIVYSSQVFYATALMKELKKLGVKTIIGGPAVNEKLIEIADAYLKNELELIQYIAKIDHDALDFDYFTDFSVYDLDDYFVKHTVIPIKTTSACYYQKCSFCTHHKQSFYFEYPLEKIKKSIISSKQKHFFFVDDMIHKKRLLDLAKMLKPLKVEWMCQLRPTKELDYETLKELNASGLKIIIWGVESGCDRVLSKMQKGTNKKDISKVLKDSHNAGINNGVFIMIGFPTETRDEFIETIEFLKANEKNIDLISTSVFGLQAGSPVYGNPAEFGITEVIEEKRTILEPKITFKIKNGMLTTEDSLKLKRGYKKTVENINKYPKEMNFFREHMLVVK